MTLRDAILELGVLSEDCVIFARVPWTLDSEIILVDIEAVETTQPVGDFAYFLEVFVVKELLEDQQFLSIEDTGTLLIQYARCDA